MYTVYGLHMTAKQQWQRMYRSYVQLNFLQSLRVTIKLIHAHPKDCVAIFATHNLISLHMMLCTWQELLITSQLHNGHELCLSNFECCDVFWIVMELSFIPCVT